MSKLITICENTLKYFDNWKVFNQLKESPRIASHSIHGQNVLRRLTAEHLLQKRYLSWRFAILSTISRRFPKKIFRKYNITVVLIVKFRQFNRKWKMMVMFWREIDRMNMCFFLWFCYKSLVSGFSSRFCIVEHRCHQFKVHLLQIKTHRWNANNSHNNRIYLFNWFVVLMFVFFSSFNKVAALLCPTLSLLSSNSNAAVRPSITSNQNWKSQAIHCFRLRIWHFCHCRAHISHDAIAHQQQQQHTYYNLHIIRASWKISFVRSFIYCRRHIAKIIAALFLSLSLPKAWPHLNSILSMYQFVCVCVRVCALAYVTQPDENFDSHIRISFP